MDPLTLASIGGIMNTISAGFDIFGGFKAKKAAKVQGQQQAMFETMITQDKLYQLRQEQRAMKGQTIAGAAGSGVKVDQGSPLEILAEQTRNFMRELTLTAKMGNVKAVNAKMGAKMTGDSAMWQGLSSGVGKLSNNLTTAFAMFGK